MSTDRVVTPGERILRALLAADGDDEREPPRELMYRRPLRPRVVLPELWRARHIVRTLTERNLRVRYKQSLLGFAWAVLSPLAMLTALTIAFHYAANVDTGSVPYPLFALFGLVPWLFFSTAISTGATSLISDKALLNKCRFPREVFPLSGVSVAAVDAALTLIPFVALFAWERRLPAATTPLAIVPIAVLVIFTVALALTLSGLVVYVRDVRLVLPLVLQLGLFVTPVAYDFSLLPPWARLAYSAINPVAPVIDSLRQTVLLGEAPQWGYLGAGTVTSLVLLVFGYALFKRLEGGFADVA